MVSQLRTCASLIVAGGAKLECTGVSAVAWPTPYSPTAPVQYFDAAVLATKSSICDCSASPANEMVTIFGALITGPPPLCTSGSGGCGAGKPTDRSGGD